MKKKYNGFLDVYHEQGISPFPVFCDHKVPYDFSYMLFFDKNSQHHITIMDKNDDIVYSGNWTFSRENTAKNNYFPSPVELPMEDWKVFCLKNYKAEIITEDRMKKDKNYINTSSKYFDLYKNIHIIS